MTAAQQRFPVSAGEEPLTAEGLLGEMDAAAGALALLDADRLEAMEQRIRTVTADQLRNARGVLPQLIEKHALLGQMLDATAANLKVLVSVLNLETRTEMR